MPLPEVVTGENAVLWERKRLEAEPWSDPLSQHVSALGLTVPPASSAAQKEQNASLPAAFQGLSRALATFAAEQMHRVTPSPSPASAVGGAREAPL